MRAQAVKLLCLSFPKGLICKILYCFHVETPKKVKREKNKEAIFHLRTITFFAQCFVPSLFIQQQLFFPSFPLISQIKPKGLM